MSADRHGTAEVPPGVPQEDSQQGPQQVPPQVVMPLLDYITAHSMDEDYVHVAERSGRTPGDTTRPARPGIAAIVAFAVFGLLVATAGVQTARNAAESSGGRESLVDQVQARSGQLTARRARAANLRGEVEQLRSLALAAASEGSNVAARLDRLELLTGAVPVTGPGVKVVVHDAQGAVDEQGRVFDEDLQKLVNALFASGAEAVSINGQRLTNLSAIRLAGAAITVNFTSINAPYTVLAVGDPDTMPARFVETKHGRDWLDLQAVYGLQLTMTREESLRLPAAPARKLTLRHATRPGGAR